MPRARWKLGGMEAAWSPAADNDLIKLFDCPGRRMQSGLSNRVERPPAPGP